MNNQSFKLQPCLMQHAQQKPNQLPVSVYSNPNENVNNKQLILSSVPQKPYIKKTFSEIHSRNSHRSSINTQTLHSKMPKVIFDLIAQKTRQQNLQRIRDSKQFNSKKSQIRHRRKSLFFDNQKTNQLFQEEDEANQKPKPTGNMRRSITARRFSHLDSIKSSTSKISCPICLIESPKKQFISICNNQCQHLYCRSCMHQYVIFKIKMFEKVTCPDQGCNITMKLTSELYAELPIDTREKFKKITQYNEVLQSEDKRICPNDECDGILDISNSQKNPQCQKCKIVYCCKCFFQSHAGECDPFQLKFFQQTLNYRQCTSCKNMIEKNQGCNHMTCRCGYQFCYLCGAKWRSTHNCEGLDPNQPIVVDTWDCCCFQCNECDFCDSLDYCCECICFDEWQICEILPVRMFSKFLIIILVLSIGLPMWMLYMLTQIIINLLMGIVYGLFVIPCDYLCEQSGYCKWIIFGIIFLQITAVILMIIGIKQVFFDGGLSDMSEQLNFPCEVINQIIEL